MDEVEELLMDGLIKRIFQLEEALTDLAVNGTRHDTTPTIGGRIKGVADVAGWYGYIESMDKYVKEKAQRALRGE